MLTRLALIAMILAVVAACGSSQRPGETPPPESSKTPFPAFTAYSTQLLGFAVRYPAGWVVKEEGGVALFDSEDDTGAHVTVRVDSAPPNELEALKSEELYRLKLFQSTGAFESPESVPVEPVVVGGLPGRTTSYVTRNVIINAFLHETVLEVFGEGRQYSMKFGVLEGRFEEVEDIFAEMVASFTFSGEAK